MEAIELLERLFQRFQETEKNITENLRRLGEEIRNTRLAMLEETFEQQKNVAVDCVDAIDRQLVKLSASIEEYQQLQSSLAASGEAISNLRGSAPEMPPLVAAETVAAFVTERIDTLKSQGKL